MPTYVDWRKGEVYYVTDLTDVSGTTPVQLVKCKPYYRKFVPVKIMIYNPDTSDHVVTLGSYNVTSSAWDSDKLVIKVLAGQMVILTEDEIPRDHVITSDPDTAVMAWAAKLSASAGTAVKVKVEFRIE